MPDLTHLLKQARRRELADAAIRRAGWGLAIGAAVAIVTLLMQRVFNISFPIASLYLLPVLGAFAGVARAAVIRPSHLQTAVNLDRTLRLKDRIGSSHALFAQRGLHIDGGFASLLRADAERLAATIDVRPATPIRITGIWGTALALCLLLWIGGAYLPAIHWGSSPKPDQPSPELLAQLQLQAQQVVQSIEQSTRDLPKDDPALDEIAREDLAALERLSEQLSQQPGSQKQVDNARDEAAARMNELADRLAEQSQRDLSASDELAQKFSGMDSTGAPKPPMSAEEFAQALKRGDFGAAAKELEDLLKKPDELSPEEKQALADHLRDTASRLENATQSDEQDAAARQEQFEQSLRDQGFTPEQIEKLRELMKRNSSSQEDIERALENQQIDPDTAEQLVRDLKQMLDEQRTDEQVQRDLNDVSQSLDDAAEQIENPPPPPPDEKQPTAENESRESPASAPATSEQTEPTQPPASQPVKPTLPTQNQRTKPQAPAASDQRPDSQPWSQDQTQPKQDQPSQEKPEPNQQQDVGNADRDSSQNQQQRKPAESQKQETASQQQQPQSRPAPSSQQQQDSAESQPQQQQQHQENPQPGEQPQSQPEAAPNQSQQTAQRDQPQNQPQSQPTNQQHQQQQQPASQPGTQQRPMPQPGTMPKPTPGQRLDQQQQQRDQSRSDQQQQPDQTQQNNQQQQQPSPDGKPQPRAGEQQPPTPDNQPSPGNQRSPQQPPQDMPSDQPQQGQPDQPKSGQNPDQSQQQRDTGASPQDKESPSPAEALKRLADRRNTAKDRQQISEQMRQRARELAERMTPEERERWAREWQKQNPQPPSPSEPQRQLPSPSSSDPDHRMARGDGGRDAGNQRTPDDSTSRTPPVNDAQPEVVDLRGNEPGEEMLSDFLEADPNAPTTGGQLRRITGDAAERIRRAQEVAERAVNDSAVPSRYHQFIKRVFGNLNKTVPAPAPTSQPGG